MKISSKCLMNTAESNEHIDVVLACRESYHKKLRIKLEKELNSRPLENQITVGNVIIFEASWKVA